jgi:hypothetical protein
MVAKRISKSPKRSPIKWKSPSRSQRENMPKKCFLMPEELKFPICKPGSSVIDKSGLHAAYVRAREWGYVSVASKASKLLRQKFDWMPWN